MPPRGAPRWPLRRGPPALLLLLLSCGAGAAPLASYGAAELRAMPHDELVRRVLAEAGAGPLRSVVPLSGGSPDLPSETGPLLRIAAVQMAAFADGVVRNASAEVSDRAAKIVNYTAQAAALGAAVVVFPEMTLTRYDEGLIAAATQPLIDAAEARVAAAAAANRVSVIFGAPRFLPKGSAAAAASCGTGQDWHNTAVVVSPEGRKVYRQAKLRCGGPDGVLGRWLDVFNLTAGGRSVPASLQICADAGDPNIARLPALKGSRILFDISQESDVRMEWKMGPYEAQYRARAHENGMWVVQANAAQELKGNAINPQGGSHGNSLVIDPLGNIVAKAPMFGEWIVLADIDPAMGARGTPGGGKYLPHAFMQPFYDAGAALLAPMPVE